MIPRCCKKVFDGSFSVRGSQCSRNGVVERDGKHYCRQHDPVAKEEARIKKHAEYRQRGEELMKVHRLHSAAPDLRDIVEAWLPGAEAMGWDTEKARAVLAKAKGETQP